MMFDQTEVYFTEQLPGKNKKRLLFSCWSCAQDKHEKPHNGMAFTA